MSTEIQSPWFTVAEAAKYAKVGEETIAKWIIEGRLKPAVTHQKKNLRGRGAAGYLIERDDIDKFLRTLKVSVAEAQSVAENAEKPKRGSKVGIAPMNLGDMLARDKA